MQNRIISINADSTKGPLRVDIQAVKNSFLAYPINMQKDVSGLTYKFGLDFITGESSFTKDLDVINAATGEIQLVLKKHDSIDDWSTINLGEYKYQIAECNDATGGDAIPVISGSFTVYDEVVAC